MIGVYKPVMKPMWSFWAMPTDAVAVLYGGLAGIAAIEFLRGTPFQPWILRLYGAKIDKGVCMEPPISLSSTASRSAITVL